MVCFHEKGNEHVRKKVRRIMVPHLCRQRVVVTMETNIDAIVAAVVVVVLGMSIAAAAAAAAVAVQVSIHVAAAVAVATVATVTRRSTNIWNRENKRTAKKHLQCRVALLTNL